MRVLVCGGRFYRNFKNVTDTLDWLPKLLGAPITVVIHGCASGADNLGRKWAKARGIPDDPYPARWSDLKTEPLVIKRNSLGKLYNAAAGSTRNARMLTEGQPDAVVAFPGGTGTKDMLAKALSHKQRVNPALRVFRVEDDGTVEEL